MPNAISTRDATISWSIGVGEANHPGQTQSFLPQRESSHLLLREPVNGEPLHSELDSIATGERRSPGQPTSMFQPPWLRMPRPQRVNTRSDERYILLKKYDGIVTARNDQSFTARLVENASDYPVLEAEFDLEELSETDRKLAVEGEALVWTIGYRYDGSTRKRESAIYLRRLSARSDEEIDKANRAALELTRGIKWE